MKTQMITNKKKKGIFVAVVFLSLILLRSALAADINFEVTTDRTKVSLGSSLQLNLNFQGTQNISAPNLPVIDGFQSRYLGPSLRKSIVNGKTFSSITHIYTLLPFKVGTFTIPSLSVRFKGKTYASKEITVEVVQGPASLPQPQQESSPVDTTQGLEDRVFVMMQINKKSAYVNEMIFVTIKLYVNQLSIRDIQFPVLEQEGFSIEEFDKPREYQEVIGGITYDVVEFNTTVFGLRAGELTLGPAIVHCNLIVHKEPKRRKRFPSFFDNDFFDLDIFDDFIGRYETYSLNLKSAFIPITIMDLPEENRPHDFDGAIGIYQFDLQAHPTEVKVGDPITLKLFIVGDGNLKTVHAPRLDFGDDFKIYDPDIQQNRDSKMFEQAVIPKNENITEIPPVSFSFFDAKSGTYKTLIKGPIPITVKPLAKGEELKVFEAPQVVAPSLQRDEELGRDIIYIKDSPGILKQKGEYLCIRRWFIFVQSLPLLLIIFVSIYQKRKKRLQTDIRYARRLRAPRNARKNLQHVKQLLRFKQANQFYDAVFKTLQEYLGDKFHLPTAGITSDVVNTLSVYDINPDVIGKLKECFENCDTARYAASNIILHQMNRTLTLLEETIDQLERLKT